jgi:hypothetical protein
VVIEVPAMEIFITDEEMIFSLFDSTTNVIDAQYIKEKQ